MEITDAKVGLLVRLNPDHIYSKAYDLTKRETVYEITGLKDDMYGGCTIRLYSTKSVDYDAIRVITNRVAAVNIHNLIIVKQEKLNLVWD